ncbi:MAG: putative Casein kinase I [Streblomastix strix]|uniref:Putative Casein kinase I n=1 Tax=Streblomastix strix TaxID=222440 RepID=A0A5J4X942_9EUKA|nr:MAG: putative Casein kinase I [Streblomastix strix]
MAVLGGQDIIFDNRLSITAHMNSFAIGDIIKNKYQIVEKINEGAFGEVYKLKIIDAPVQNEDEKEEILENFLAVKIESGSIFPSQIAIEAKIYKDMQGIQGFANKILAGTWRGYRLLIMDRLGPSIEEIFISSKRMFSLRTVLELGIQMIQRVKDLHEKGWIHRDLKPQNFVVGLGKLSKTIFLIDFGLARRYEINQGKECVSVKKNNFAGTLRYWSVNTHMGIEQSRRDDLEAIGYIIIYLLKGFLPWQGQRGPNSRIRRQMIGDLKRKITMSELCKYLPNEIMGFLTYVRSLSLHQNPDYSYCIKLLRQAFINSGFLKSDSWEWNDKGEIIMMDEDESGQQRLLPQMLDKQNAEELKRDREIWRAAKKLRMLDDQVKIKAFLSQDPTNRGSKFRMRLERIQQGLKELEEEEKEENRRWIQMLTLNSIAESNKMQQRINISGIKLNLKNPQLSKLRPSSVNAVYGLDLAGQSRQKWSNFGPSNPGVMKD